jgi:hypothetical protein
MKNITLAKARRKADEIVEAVEKIERCRLFKQGLFTLERGRAALRLDFTLDFDDDGDDAERGAGNCRRPSA